MKRFRSIMLPLQGQRKSELHWLYNTRYSASPKLEEDEKDFSHNFLRFRFEGTGFRNTEKLLLKVEIPSIEGHDLEMKQQDTVLFEHFLLSEILPVINELSREYLNTAKNVREKAQFSVQNVGVCIIRRNGMLYDKNKSCFVLQMNFNVPLVNALSINAKAAIRAIRDILDSIESTVEGLDRKKLNRYIEVYTKQREIRRYLKTGDYCAFIADGSILPRENGTDSPMAGAVAFVSPKDFRITIPLSDGSSISGMGIKKGVTVITGGGYSGKSTLLDAIERGIYNHVPEDGREFVITDESALKIYAEDGRPVHNLDLSPFFTHLPGAAPVENFSTLHASGSVSQAANIIEAVNGKSKVLLIDEDKSATNFMICDRNMREIVKNDPIIPFTDRVNELYCQNGVSTILVIGGSSEYLACADNVVLMDNYVAKNITDEVSLLRLYAHSTVRTSANFFSPRFLIPQRGGKDFIYFKTVETENEKKIILDDYSADITRLTSLISGSQMNSLSDVMRQLLNDEKSDSDEILSKIEIICQNLFEKTSQNWLEEVRPIDALCCINRMRGATFNR